MMRSMFSGVSGLKNHQIRMDVIGNNIANVNTVGYKGSRVTFQDTLNQTLRGVSAPQGGRGGLNAVQIGLGVALTSIDVIHTQGNLQNTGNVTDLAIQGEGFFILGDGVREFYTRAGQFTLEKNGSLVNPSNGLLAQGWLANPDGTIDTSGPITGIVLPIGRSIDPIVTTDIDFRYNLNSETNGKLTYAPNPQTVTDADGNNMRLTFVFEPTDNFNEWTWKATVGEGTIASGSATGTIRMNSDGTVAAVTQDGGGSSFEILANGGTTPVTITLPTVGAANGGAFTTSTGGSFNGNYTPPEQPITTARVIDSLGASHLIYTKFSKVDNNQWNWTATDQTGNTVYGSGTIVFDSKGRVTTAAGSSISFTPPGADPISILPNLDQLTQYASDTTISANANGYPMGELESYNIDSNGCIIGVFSNGLTQVLAQVAIATFNNPSGLVRYGDTMFMESSNSGVPQIGAAGTGNKGEITPGALEMSNVDLSQEFTDMIVTQRGFQANSRIITTSDEMLQELVNLKR